MFILSDDEDLASHRVMAKTKALIEDQGTVLANYFVSYSFCCPSRATTLRGQYPHNHRVEGNEWPTGGYEKFRALGLESSTIATWLHDGGYRTAFLGKLMNGYLPEKHPPAPGWDEWYGVGGKFENFDYTLNENGRLVAYGHRPEDHLTDVLAGKAADVIRRADPAQPLFLYVAPYDPHSPATPAPRYAGLYADEPLPQPPSFDEPDVSDKPSYVGDLPPLAPWQKEALTKHNRERLRALRAVDDLVGTVMAALAETGRLDNTYVVYTSDNGFHMGQHRLFVGKTTAYEEDIHVPLVHARAGRAGGADDRRHGAEQRPGADLRRHRRGPAAELRRRPVVPAAAGQAADGRGGGASWSSAGRWRRTRSPATRSSTGSAPPPTPMSSTGPASASSTICAADPFELSNLVRTADPALLAALSERLAELKNCAVEQLPPARGPARGADHDPGGRDRRAR